MYLRTPLVFQKQIWPTGWWSINAPDVPRSPHQQFTSLPAFPLAHFYHISNEYIRERRRLLLWTFESRRKSATLAVKQNMRRNQFISSATLFVQILVQSCQEQQGVQEKRRKHKYFFFFHDFYPFASLASWCRWRAVDVCLEDRDTSHKSLCLFGLKEVNFKIKLR